MRLFSRLALTLTSLFMAAALHAAGDPRRIDAIGDLHGDYAAFAEIAQERQLQK